MTGGGDAPHTYTVKSVRYAAAFALCCSLLPASCAVLSAGRYAGEALLSESDYLAAEAALPAFIKVAEVAYRAAPKDAGTATTLASLYLLYGTAFIEGETLYLPDEAFAERETRGARARDYYRRAFKTLEPFIRRVSPGLFEASFILDSGGVRLGSPTADPLRRFKKRDAPLLYYGAASIFAAFGSNPLDFTNAARLPQAFAMLERALALDPGYEAGAVYELAMQIYASMPTELGGSRDKALAAYEAALRASGGGSAAAYVSYAALIALPDGDEAAFKEALEAAIAVDPAAHPERTLFNVLARRKAEYYLNSSGDLFF